MSFNENVRHILSNNCFKCHGPDDRARKRRPRLDTFDGATAEARSGLKPIVPGDAEASELVRRVTSDNPEYRMPPPDEGPPLDPAAIETLRRWIAEGAEYEPHWSYMPPERPALPDVEREDWVRNPIDRFVLARLEREGLTPSDEADPYALVRRVYLDLIGLPPTPEQIERFVSDNEPRAYARLVDRLLESPRYGEHWARMWLDLARYADTKGYEKDEPRTMWPYRDWVIRALNEDMPYDQFTIEQLAGDLLDDPTRNQLIATAFHRNTMTNDEGGTDDEEFRVAAVVDRVNTTFQAWMGTTINCAQCHDHKYDPIAQREYYEVFAFFNQTEDNDQPDESPTLSLADETQRERLAHLDQRIAEAEAALEEAGSEPTHTDTEPLEETIKKLKDQKKRLAESIPQLPIMRALGPEQRRETHVHRRGSFLNEGDRVSPDTPDAFHPLQTEWPRNRLGFAQWLVAETNPLTPRVAVNRHWEQIFGTGIVKTSEEFGTQGELPSHPDLLDWLAVEFMESGWSLKQLCRLIVTSATYRQASRVSPDLLERDPDNRLLARGPRVRLDAETIRDAALRVSGLLSDKMYGPSVMPYQPDGVWKVVYSSRSWEMSEGEDRYRRGLYTFWRRTAPYPSMMAFDASSREVCTVRRVRTNTPLQALVLLNDPVYVEAAQALGRRTAAAPAARPRDKAALAFKRVLARPGTERELDRLVRLYKEEVEHYRGDPDAAIKLATQPLGPLAEEEDAAEAAAWTVVANVLLNLDEFITKR